MKAIVSKEMRPSGKVLAMHVCEAVAGRVSAQGMDVSFRGQVGVAASFSNDQLAQFDRGEVVTVPLGMSYQYSFKLLRD